MKRLILAMFLALVVLQIYAQTEREQKFLQMEQEVAQGNLDDNEMFDKCLKLLWRWYSDEEKARYYFQKSLATARKMKDEAKESKCYIYMGAIYSDWGKKDSAVSYLDYSMELLEGKKFFEEECLAYQVRGKIFYDMDSYEKSMSDFHKAIEINEKDKVAKIAAKQDISQCLRTECHFFSFISIIHGALFNDEKSLEYLFKAQKIIDDNPNVDFLNYQQHKHTNFAAIYFRKNEYEKAFPHIEAAYKLAKEQEDYPNMTFVLHRYSDYYSNHLKDYNTALKYSKEGLQIAEKTKEPQLIYLMENQLLKIYIHLNDYQIALNYIERLLPKAEELDNWIEHEQLYSYSSLVYALLGEKSKALHYLTLSRETAAKIYNKNLHKVIQEMEVKYDVQQKELAILHQQSEINRHQTLRYFYLSGLLITIFLLALVIYIAILRTRRNRILAESNASKDRFFNIISHDLKNPAIAQRDALQLLLDNSDKWDTASLTNYYQKLLKSANGQVELLYSLLSWAQLQAGRMIYNPARFDLVAAISLDLDMIKTMSDDKGIEFNIQTPETALVTGDFDMLTTVVRNLLTNAVKYTNKGGEVTLEISQCDGKDAACHVSTEVSVYDTGIGMTPEQIQNLFHIDRHQSRKGTAGEQGSGFGLIVCRELLEKHGSKLNIESEEGKGSRFWFRI